MYKLVEMLNAPYLGLKSALHTKEVIKYFKILYITPRWTMKCCCKGEKQMIDPEVHNKILVFHAQQRD